MDLAISDLMSDSLCLSPSSPGLWFNQRARRTVINQQLDKDFEEHWDHFLNIYDGTDGNLTESSVNQLPVEPSTNELIIQWVCGIPLIKQTEDSKNLCKSLVNEHLSKSPIHEPSVRPTADELIAELAGGRPLIEPSEYSEDSEDRRVRVADSSSSSSSADEPLALSPAEQHLASPSAMAHGFQPLSHANDEVVLTAAFNKYGNRLVTGSADHRLRVFDEKDGNWVLTEVWRGHNAEVLQVKWNAGTSWQIIGSVSSDLKLKLWSEDESSLPLSGHRFYSIFSQSSAHAPVAYVSLDFCSVHHETYLAAVTRDGLLSLSEPVDPDSPDDWKELDQFYLCDARLPRGVETCFRIAFQQAERPNYRALDAGLDPRALSLAVTALDAVKVYRVVGSGYERSGPYRFQTPVAELMGARGLVRDVAWAPASFREVDLIATASADGYVRIYEIWTPVPATSTDTGGQSSQQQAQQQQTAQPGSLTKSESFSSVHNRSSAAGPRPHGPPPPPLSSISAGLASASRAGSTSDPSGGSIQEAGQIVHEWKLAAQLKHESVWQVEWIQEGQMLISTGDSGKAHVWAKGKDKDDAEKQVWLEFADFGPEAEEEEEE